MAPQWQTTHLLSAYVMTAVYDGWSRPISHGPLSAVAPACPPSAACNGTLAFRCQSARTPAEGLRTALSSECCTSRLWQSSVGWYWYGQGRQTFCAAWPRNELGKPDTSAFFVISLLKAAVESRRLLEKLVASVLSCMLISLKRLVASTLASSLLLPSGTAACNQRSSLWCHCTVAMVLGLPSR